MLSSDAVARTTTSSRHRSPKIIVIRPSDGITQVILDNFGVIPALGVTQRPYNQFFESFRICLPQHQKRRHLRLPTANFVISFSISGSLIRLYLAPHIEQLA